jgi:hypothetical protein
MDYSTVNRVRDQDVINHIFLEKLKTKLLEYLQHQKKEYPIVQVNNDSKAEKDPNRIMIFEMDP